MAVTLTTLEAQRQTPVLENLTTQECSPHRGPGLQWSCLVLLAAFLLILALLLCRRILVLLVLRDKVIHVGLRLGELHLVHALASVPVKESLAAEHGGKLLSDALHHLLHARRVAKEAY